MELWKIILETGQSPFIHVTSPEARLKGLGSNKLQHIRGVGTRTGAMCCVLYVSDGGEARSFHGGSRVKLWKVPRVFSNQHLFLV